MLAFSNLARGNGSVCEYVKKILELEHFSLGILANKKLWLISSFRGWNFWYRVWSSMHFGVPSPRLSMQPPLKSWYWSKSGLRSKLDHSPNRGRIPRLKLLLNPMDSSNKQTRIKTRGRGRMISHRSAVAVVGTTLENVGRNLHALVVVKLAIWERIIEWLSRISGKRGLKHKHLH